MKTFDCLQYSNDGKTARIVWDDQSVTPFLQLINLQDDVDDPVVAYKNQYYNEQGETYTPNQSWLRGDYDLDCCSVKIDTDHEFVMFAFNDSTTYTFQGDEAVDVINTIHQMWLEDNSAVIRVLGKYINLYF